MDNGLQREVDVLRGHLSRLLSSDPMDVTGACQYCGSPTAAKDGSGGLEHHQDCPWKMAFDWHNDSDELSKLNQQKGGK